MLIRGKPSSGKTTVARKLVRHFDNYKMLDPDEINTESREYKHFSPRKTKNPTDNVKMYCFLYNQAEIILKSGGNVVWAQPWSRLAELDLTVRNFGYYFTNLKEHVWTTKVAEVATKLPFTLLIIEVDADDNVIISRWLSNNPRHNSDELERLKKTVKYFQPANQTIPCLKINGNTRNANIEPIIDFIQEELNKHKINTQS